MAGAIRSSCADVLPASPGALRLPGLQIPSSPATCGSGVSREAGTPSACTCLRCFSRSSFVAYATPTGRGQLGLQMPCSPATCGSGVSREAGTPSGCTCLLGFQQIQLRGLRHSHSQMPAGAPDAMQLRHLWERRKSRGRNTIRLHMPPVFQQNQLRGSRHFHSQMPVGATWVCIQICAGFSARAQFQTVRRLARQERGRATVYPVFVARVPEWRQWVSALAAGHMYDAVGFVAG